MLGRLISTQVAHVFIAVLLQLAVSVPQAFAEPQADVIRAPSSKPDSESLIGLDQRVIIERFGEADSITKSKDGLSELHYGKSVIFLSDYKVSAVSDIGDLRVREKISSISVKPKEIGKDPFSGRWENLWTPKKNDAETEQLQELLAE